MNLKYFHVNHWHILSQTTYMLNMDLRYQHTAELLHSLLVAMVTVFHSNKGDLQLHIATKNIYTKYELEILSYCLVIAQILCCYGYSCYHSNHVNQWHILPQGTHVPNMDLRYLHKAELLQFACCHGNSVSMATRLPINMYCPKEQLCQIWTWNTSIWLSYCSIVLLLWLHFVSRNTCA